MPHKPCLIVHAGLPKCATTSLQWLFYHNDHNVSRDAGLVWIGKGLSVWGAFAPVSEIMYDEEGSIARLHDLQLDPDATYFLSSEALAQHPHFLGALADRFDLCKIVLSVRFPLLKEVSEFCFSGWINSSLAGWPMTGRADHISRIVDRLGRFAPVSLCPVEPAGLAGRFCGLVAPRVPDGVDDLLANLGSANASISPVLAEALHRHLNRLGDKHITGQNRQQIVTHIRESPQAQWFRSEQPMVLHKLLSNAAFLKDELTSYRTLLQDHGVAPSEAADACEGARAQLAQMATRPVPDAARQAQVDFYAERLITAALT